MSQLVNILIIILIVLITINIVIGIFRFIITKRFEKTLAKLVLVNTEQQNMWLDMYKREAAEVMKNFDIVKREYYQQSKEQDKKVQELSSKSSLPVAEPAVKPKIKKIVADPKVRKN
jgi:hypothetical protein